MNTDRARQENAPYQNYLTKTSEEVLRLFGVTAAGLSDEDVRAARSHYGENTIPRHRASWIAVLARQYTNPFIALLVVAALIAVFLRETTDALMIVVILFVNGFLGFFEEFRAERALEALEVYLVPRVRVRRNGVVKSISITELVPGDIVPLEIGDHVPADIRLTSVVGLTVNESVLTGESVDVPKDTVPMTAMTDELSSVTNIVFSGTSVKSGRGEGVVVATGARMVLGSIAHRLHQIERTSGFEENLRRFSSMMMKIVIVTIVFLFALNWFLKRNGVDIPELLLFVLTLAISVVPEALPVVTTVAMASGAARLAKRGVVVRRLSALDDLGTIDVLCTDKTGTITENKMRVTQIVAADEKKFLDAALAEVLWQKERTPGGVQGLGSFDRALWDTLEVAPPEVQPRGATSRTQVVWDFPFDPTRRLSAVVSENAHGARLLIVRGAPEEIIRYAVGDAAHHEQMLSDVRTHGTKGVRTLAVGTRILLHGETLSVEIIKNLAFEGYVCFEDPLKPTTKEALATARALHVDVRIITGDSAEVAFSVGRAVGLVTNEDEVVTGARLQELSENDRVATIERSKIFARISPEEKYQIIKTLQKNHAVGFLGEGVNDAPALELANVALVVNNAAPVARGAADIVLEQSDLRVIVSAIEEGRKIFENIGKYLKYTLIGNFGNFYSMAGITLLLPFVPLLPTQMLLTNVLTDLPLIAISLDRVARDDVRFPRPFVVRTLIGNALFLGLVSSAFDFLFFGFFRHENPATFRTLWFVFSILTELALIFSIRSRGFFLRGPKPVFPLVALGVAAGMTALLLPVIPATRTLFHFVSLNGSYGAFIALLVVGYFITTESAKLVFNRWQH